MNERASPKVSVVLPVHNRASTIRGAVESVLEQTHVNLELIVVDDGSTDGTCEALSMLSDPRVRVERLARNIGANAARNAGIRRSIGEFIALQDSDDRWMPHKLEAQLRAFEPVVGLVWCPFRHHSLDGSVELVGGNMTGLDMADTRRRLLRASFISTQTVVIRRSLLTEENLFDPAMPRLQDWELWLRLSTQTEFASVAEPLVDVYQSEGSISSNATALVTAHRIILEKHWKLFADAGNEVLASRLAKLGHLEMVWGNPDQGRSRLRAAAQLHPRPRLVARASLAHLGAAAYRCVFEGLRG